jgi:hypothetical protein
LTTRIRRLDPRDVTTARRIPVTTVARTIVDLAAVLGIEVLARAFHEADVLYGTTPAQIEAALARAPRAPGVKKLRRIIRGDEPVILSELERTFLRLLRKWGLPLPITNRPASGKRVDCRWPEYRLTVELDSYRYHRSRYAWEQDHRRRREARTRGDAFQRYTWADLEEDQDATRAELTKLVAPSR